MATPRKPAPANTGKQRNPFRLEVFVHHVAIDGNQARAARLAGVSPESAKQRGHELMQDPDVQVLVEQRREAVRLMLQNDLGRSLTELESVAYSRIDDGIDICRGRLIVHDLTDVPERLKPAIAEVRQLDHGVQIKLHPKVPALLALARHQGLRDAQRHEHTGADGQPLPAAPPAIINYHLPAAPRLKRKAGTDGS